MSSKPSKRDKVIRITVFLKLEFIVNWFIILSHKHCSEWNCRYSSPPSLPRCSWGSAAWDYKSKDLNSLFFSLSSFCYRMWSVENLPNLLFLEDLDKHLLPLTLCFFFSSLFSCVPTSIFSLVNYCYSLYKNVWGLIKRY